MPEVNLSQAAAAAGISRQQLQRMLGDGRLADWDRGRNSSGHQLVELEGLRGAALSRMRQTIASAHGKPEPMPWGEEAELMLRALNLRVLEAVEHSGLPDSPELAVLIDAVAREVGEFWVALLTD